VGTRILLLKDGTKLFSLKTKMKQNYYIKNFQKASQTVSSETFAFKTQVCIKKKFTIEGGNSKIFVRSEPVERVNIRN
jgi:hypothetical protein